MDDAAKQNVDIEGAERDRGRPQRDLYQRSRRGAGRVSCWTLGSSSKRLPYTVELACDRGMQNRDLERPEGAELPSKPPGAHDGWIEELHVADLQASRARHGIGFAERIRERFLAQNRNAMRQHRRRLGAVRARCEKQDGVDVRGGEKVFERLMAATRCNAMPLADEIGDLSREIADCEDLEEIGPAREYRQVNDLGNRAQPDDAEADAVAWLVERRRSCLIEVRPDMHPCGFLLVVS